jgi:hypothetical protein|tara:strand:+ start:258 stop:368 length:111 start_codon:yes stop_codon:yes gene_type:complete
MIWKTPTVRPAGVVGSGFHDVLSVGLMADQFLSVFP